MNTIISSWLQCLSLLFGSQKYKQVNRFYPLQWGLNNCKRNEHKTLLYFKCQMYSAQSTNKGHFDTLLAVDETAISTCSSKPVYRAKEVPSSKSKLGHL